MSVWDDAEKELEAENGFPLRRITQLLGKESLNTNPAIGGAKMTYGFLKGLLNPYEDEKGEKEYDKKTVWEKTKTRLGSALAKAREYSPAASRLAGMVAGVPAAGFSTIPAVLTPYKDPSEAEEFYEKSLYEQTDLRAKSILDSWYDAILKEGGFGKNYSEDYWKSQTGTEAPGWYEVFDFIADPTIVIGAGKLPKLGSKLFKLNKLDRVVEAGIKNIDNVTAGEIGKFAAKETTPQTATKATRTIDEALSKKQGTMSVWDEAEKTLKEEAAKVEPKGEVKPGTKEPNIQSDPYIKMVFGKDSTVHLNGDTSFYRGMKESNNERPMAFWTDEKWIADKYAERSGGSVKTNKLAGDYIDLTNDAVIQRLRFEMQSQSVKDVLSPEEIKAARNILDNADSLSLFEVTKDTPTNNAGWSAIRKYLEDISDNIKGFYFLDQHTEMGGYQKSFASFDKIHPGGQRLKAELGKTKEPWNATMKSRLETVNQEVAQNREKIIAQSRKQAEYDGWLERWTPEKAIDDYYREHSGINTSGWKPLKKGETWKGRLEKLAEKETAETPTETPKTEIKEGGATTIPPEGIRAVNDVPDKAGEVKQGIPEARPKPPDMEPPKPDSIRIENNPELKTAKAARDANRQFAESGIRELPEDELAKYSSVVFEQLKAKIASFMDSHSIDELSDMIIGNKPSGLSKTEEQVLYNSLKKRAIITADEELGDKLTKAKIATERSELAQALGASRLGNLIDDPIETFKTITKENTEKAMKRTGKKPVDVSSKLNDLSEGLKSIEKKIVEKVRGTKSITELEKDLKKAIDEDNYPKVEMIISKMTRAFGEAGILERDASTQAVLEVVRKHIPTASFEAVRDAQSKAGQWKAWAKDEISTKLVQNNQERVALYKIDELKGNRIPNPSGQPRPPMSNELPLLNKIVNQGMKRLGIKSLIRDENQIPIAAIELEKDITRAINDIKKLEKQIIDEDFAVNVRGEKQRAPQLQKLLDEKKRLQDIVKEKRLALDPNAQYRARLEKERKDLNELLKMAEEADASSLEVMRKAYSAKTPKKAIDPDTRALIIKRDQLKNDYDTIMKASGIPTKAELGKLMSLSRDKMRLAEQFDAKTGKWSSEEAAALYGYAADDYKTFVELLKNGDYTLKELASRRLQEFKTTWKGADSAEGRPFIASRDVMFDLFKEISLASKAMVGSWDNSFIFRQGRHVLMTHPSAWWPGVKTSFKVLFQSLIEKHGAAKAMKAVRANIMSDPLYMDGTFQKAGIVDFVEEEFMSNLPHRIPGFGRIFKASEASFVAAGEMMRTTAFKVMYQNALRSGAADSIKSGAIKVDDLIKDFGEIAGSLTGRSGAKVPEIIQPVLWAPKMVAANLNILTGHYAGFGGQLRTSFARAEARRNLGKIASGYLGLALVINQIKPGTIELDWRSSDFLKGRAFNTRIDLTQGIGQYVVYFARAIHGLAGVAGIGEGGVKSAQTKIMHKINTGNEKDPTLQDLTIQFFINKSAPFPRTIIDAIFRGKNFEGEKPTLGNIALSMFAPIPAQNMWKNTKGDYAVASELWSSSLEIKVAGLATALELLGFSANTYIPTKVYSEMESIEMNELRQMIGKDKLKKLEIIYNKTVNSRIDEMVKRQKYLDLPNEEKKKVIERIRRETKRQVFKL